MIRYHFTITIHGVRANVNVNARNPQSAYGKVKRLIQWQRGFTL